jgi:serine/threonine protein kinase
VLAATIMLLAGDGVQSLSYTRRPRSWTMSQSIGEFEIVRPLGQGGFGQVLLGKHKTTLELRALKILQGSPQPGSPQHRALQNEIALAPRIIHDNVVRVFGSGVDPSVGEYLIEEFVDGTSLRAFIDSLSSALPYEEARELMRGISRGLSAINAMMVHRDVHPGNILLSGTTPKLTDFGLAKLAAHETRTQTFKGVQHVHYKSPEGWKREKNSFLMDVYSAGIVFFEILARNHPFEIQGRLTTSDDWRDAHLFADRPRLRDLRSDVPPAISSLISEMMAVARSDRPEWERILDVLDHDREVPSWLSLAGEAGRRAQEAAERKRELVHRFEQEQEYFYRATCNRFLCELEDLIAEASEHLVGPVRTSRNQPHSLTFELGENRITCVLFRRLREECVVPVGPVLGGGYLEGGGHLMNIVVCSLGDDDFGGSWWIYPTDTPTKDEQTFYQQLVDDDGAELEFVAHAVRGFSALLHMLFLPRQASRDPQP